MSNSKGRTISFTVESPEKRDEINKFAIFKGFQNASILARFALYQYIHRYPGKIEKPVQPQTHKDSIEEVADGDAD